MTDFHRLTGQDWSLLPQAAAILVKTQFGSTAMLQRKLRIRFGRACLLMDCLEKLKVVGPAPGGTQARKVLIGEDGLELLEHAINIERERADAAG